MPPQPLLWVAWVSGQAVGQALARNATEHSLTALPIVEAVSAVAVTEIELCQIPAQMLLAAMLVDALHAALEDTIAEFKRSLTALRDDGGKGADLDQFRVDAG